MSVQPIAQAAKEDVTELARDALVALGGIATTLAVVYANHWAARRFDFDLLSLSFYFIFPFGAMVGGMAAATGYYIAARLTQTMPTRRLAWEMAAIAVSAWALHHWLVYDAATFDDGARVRDAVGFGSFLRAMITHQSLVISGSGAEHTTGALGRWGYAREALQVLGFALGGLAVYAMLRQVEACAGCRRYAKVTPVMRGVTPEQFGRGLVSAGLDADEVALDADARLKGRRLTGMDLGLARCPLCARAWLRPALRVQVGRNAGVEALARVPLSAEQAEAVQGIAPEFRRPLKAA